MPGVHQHTRDSLRKAVAEAAGAGLGGVMLVRDPDRARRRRLAGAPTRTASSTSPSPTCVAEVGDALVVQADLCLDEFTDHGHCGVLTPAGAVDNDATLVRYAEMAARAGGGGRPRRRAQRHDGRPGRARPGRPRRRGRDDVAVLAYAAKYASAFYGPFRDAVESQLEGDRRTYQMDPANRREAVREVAIDLAEGADIVMVKPAPGLPRHPVRRAPPCPRSRSRPTRCPASTP